MEAATVQMSGNAEFVIEPLAPFGAVVRSTRDNVALSSIPNRYWQDLVREHLFVVFRGIAQEQLTAQYMLSYAQGFGELLEWPFGYVLDVKVEPDTKNYLFTRHRVEFHCDGVFAKAEPNYLFFHCVHAPTLGGESLLADTHRVLRAVRPSEREWLSKITCRYEQPMTAHYGGHAVLPLVSKHPKTGVDVIRYAEPVAGPGGSAPVVVEGDRTNADETARLAEFMADVLYRPGACLTHRWRDGDVALLDNHRLLHGRRAFGDASVRHLRRIHVL